MYPNLVLLGVMLASGSYAAMLVWRKIPLLLQVPQQLIEQSFVTRPSRVKHALEGAVAFVREKRHYDACYAVAFALLGWLRLRLVRLERSVFYLSSMLDARRHATSMDQRQYWDALKREPSGAAAGTDAPAVRKPEETSAAVVAAPAPIAIDSMPAVTEQPKPAPASAMDSVVPRDAARVHPRPRAAAKRTFVRRRGASEAHSLPE